MKMNMLIYDECEATDEYRDSVRTVLIVSPCPIRREMLFNTLSAHYGRIIVAHNEKTADELLARHLVTHLVYDVGEHPKRSDCNAQVAHWRYHHSNLANTVLIADDELLAGDAYNTADSVIPTTHTKQILLNSLKGPN